MNVFVKRVQNAVHRRRVHGWNNQRIRELAGKVASEAKGSDNARPVVMFNASTRLEGMSLNAAFQLLTGWSLRLVGAHVVQFACQGGMKQCVLGTNRDNLDSPPPCERCTAQSRVLYTSAEVNWFRYQEDTGLADRLKEQDLDSLMALEYQGVPLGQLVLPSLRWILRRHHLKDDETTRKLIVNYILSAWNIVQQFGALLDRVNPQSVVVFNGMFYPEASARWATQKRGIRCISHEVGLHPFCGYFTNGEATAYPIDIPHDFVMSPAQDKLLDDLLAERFKGNFSMAGIRFWPEMQPLSEEFWQRARQFKQIVPVFTNVIFDTSQGHANVIYPHMFAWLDDVLDIIRDHPETFFVIRAHPDETRPGKASQESVSDWVKAGGVDQLPNVLYVDPDAYFSSYELIAHSKFVMVYNSTIGLEASLLGAAVLCGGKARFTQIPTVFFPDTADAFRQQAQAFLSADNVESLPEHRLNARRFLYYQVFRTSLPFTDYIREDGVWQGYVTLKNFELAQLKPENSVTLRTVVEGVLDNKPFLLPDPVEGNLS